MTIYDKIPSRFWRILGRAEKSSLCKCLSTSEESQGINDAKSDPNGIRTRVTAVKGRCPRPLDDRVTKPPNIPFDSRKANLPPFSARECKIDHQPCSAGGSAAMCIQGFPRVLHDFFAIVGICQEIRHGPPQFGRRVDLNRSPTGQQCVCQRREIFHMGTKYNRFPGQDRLSRILPASCE